MYMSRNVNSESSKGILIAVTKVDFHNVKGKGYEDKPILELV